MGMFDLQILDVLRDVAAELKKIREELEKANKNEKEKPLALARIVERLEEAESYSCSPQFSKAIDRAIEIVKEEGDCIMPERISKVETVLVEMVCEQCGEGMMVAKGDVLLSNPPQYRHICNNCGFTTYYTGVTYPHTKIVPVEENKHE